MTTSTVHDTGEFTYRSDLQLGKRYRDKTTGLEGHLIGIHFYEHACERATLRYVDSMERVQEVSFDAPELVDVETGAQPVVARTGGPARSTGARAVPTR